LAMRLASSSSSDAIATRLEIRPSSPMKQP
jgi:hypothetical protein